MPSRNLRLCYILFVEKNRKHLPLISEGMKFEKRKRKEGMYESQRTIQVSQPLNPQEWEKKKLAYASRYYVFPHPPFFPFFFLSSFFFLLFLLPPLFCVHPSCVKGNEKKKITQPAYPMMEKLKGEGRRERRLKTEKNCEPQASTKSLSGICLFVHFFLSLLLLAPQVIGKRAHDLRAHNQPSSDASLGLGDVSVTPLVSS